MENQLYVFPTLSANTDKLDELLGQLEDWCYIQFDYEEMSQNEFTNGAWDAALEIKGDKLIISGSAGASGWGSSVTTVPFGDFVQIFAGSRFFFLYVEKENEEQIRKIVTECGWEILE